MIIVAVIDEVSTTDAADDDDVAEEDAKAAINPQDIMMLANGSLWSL